MTLAPLLDMTDHAEGARWRQFFILLLKVSFFIRRDTCCGCWTCGTTSKTHIE